MAKMTEYELRAHAFERHEDGSVATRLHLGGGAPRVLVGADSFAALEGSIAVFGKANAPCNVWVRCLATRKPRGFDVWNKGATRWLFEAPTGQVTTIGA